MRACRVDWIELHAKQLFPAHLSKKRGRGAFETSQMGVVSRAKREFSIIYRPGSTESKFVRGASRSPDDASYTPISFSSPFGAYATIDGGQSLQRCSAVRRGGGRNAVRESRGRRCSGSGANYVFAAVDGRPAFAGVSHFFAPCC